MRDFGLGLKCLVFYGMFAFLSLCFLCEGAIADVHAPAHAPKSAFDRFNVSNIFTPSLPTFDAPKAAVVEMPSEPPVPAEAPSTAAPVASSPAVEFVSSDPSSHIYPPDVRAPVRINPEAPGPFKSMAVAHQQGDYTLATQYADQYVRYQVDLMFEVRALTQLVGEALVRQGVVDEEDWVGVSQFLEMESAGVRETSGSALRATHDLALRQIKPDLAGKAEVFFFFTPDCRWCRDMAPDVERLWRVAEKDANLNVIVLTAAQTSPALVEAFRDYTGLTMPIMDGTRAAKSFRIGFVPAIVVLSPTQEVAYLQTGSQTFERMYEFVRKVQGQPLEMSSELQKFVSAPIGEVEIQQASGRGVLWEEQVEGRAKAVAVNLQSKRLQKVSLEKF